MDNEIDFGELSTDENFKKRILDFKSDFDRASDTMKTFFNNYNYEQLSTEDKIRYDLFMAFAINSYFWMYLRIRGMDPSQNDIMSQIKRVREYMIKSKQIYEKKTLMPRVNQDAAKRILRNALWDSENSSETNNKETNYSLKRKIDEVGD